MPTDSTATIVDGSLDWSAGVNSLKCTTVQSERNPNGLRRNELAWLNNGTVRGGAISPRPGWQRFVNLWDATGKMQDGFMYEPDFGYPYFICVISGHVLRVDLDTKEVTNLSVIGNFYLASVDRCFFCQAEQFLVIQDGVSLPLFWDGATLRRSVGITNNAVAPGANGINEIPVATCMDYYMGRLWYAIGRTVHAGDIVKGPSGTLANQFRDAVLNVTENPLAVGGDGFTVPTCAGNIRALKHTANLDRTLGVSPLFIFTRQTVYALEVPVTREDWINSTATNQPEMRPIQIVNGSVNDRSVVAVNGDLFYQSLEPSIRSLFVALRYFSQWGNIPISSNLQRMLSFNDRALLWASSGIVFDNRLLETALPTQLPQGVVHRALAVLDFVPLASLNEQSPPVWEGLWEGWDIGALYRCDYGGRERAFATIVSRLDSSIQLWELTNFARADGDDKRITWRIEWPAFTWQSEFDLKKLVSDELWIDGLWGEVLFFMEYRPDGDVCWHKWHEWKLCSSRNSCEDVENPVCYPLEPHCESFRSTITLPLPPIECQNVSARQVNIGYQFQCRLTITGWCRIRGNLLHAERVSRKLYEGLVC